MASYVVVQFTVNDEQAFQRYAVESRKTIRAHGGKVIARGRARVLHGDAAHEWGAILEFPSPEEADAWFHSPEYQALAELRDRTSSQAFLAYPAFVDEDQDD